VLIFSVESTIPMPCEWSCRGVILGHEDSAKNQAGGLDRQTYVGLSERVSIPLGLTIIINLDVSCVLGLLLIRRKARADVEDLRRVSKDETREWHVR
jgi:hypothetical protein